MKELIEYISKALVDEPEMVNVSEIQGDQTTVIELRVKPEDIGKVIGKKGRTAQAMRILLAAVASKDKKRAVLEIVE
jgi:predicted RNA-binding protein YlqC (UPF0109 family)